MSNPHLLMFSKSWGNKIVKGLSKEVVGASTNGTRKEQTEGIWKDGGGGH